MIDKYHLEAIEKFKKSIDIGEKELLDGEKEEEEEEIQYVENVEGKNDEERNKKKDRQN